MIINYLLKLPQIDILKLLNSLNNKEIEFIFSLRDLRVTLHKKFRLVECINYIVFYLTRKRNYIKCNCNIIKLTKFKINSRVIYLTELNILCIL